MLISLAVPKPLGSFKVSNDHSEVPFVGPLPCCRIESTFSPVAKTTLGAKIRGHLGDRSVKIQCSCSWKKMWLSHEIWSCPIFRHIYVQEPSENVASYPNKQREEFYGCKETRNRTALPSFSQLRIGSTKKTVKFCWPWSDEQYLPVKEHSPLWEIHPVFFLVNQLQRSCSKAMWVYQRVARK